VETLTATVTPTAAGSVQFQDGTAPIGNPVTVTNGTASITPTLPSGTHSLTAVFTPTNPTAFTGSTSPTVPYLVNAAITTTTLGVTPASPVDKNTAETLTATVTPTAAGSVQFTDGTAPIGNLATVTNGTASITTTLGSGTHSLTAMFAPTDPATFGSSTSNTVSYVVSAPSGAKATTTTLRVFPNRAFEGIPVIFLANVAPRGATGTIQFMDGTTTLGTPVPVTAGFALTITTLPLGMHPLSAVFTPKSPAAFAQSASAPVALMVNPLLSRVPLR
jgi:hypothetical protein